MKTETLIVSIIICIVGILMIFNRSILAKALSESSRTFFGSLGIKIVETKFNTVFSKILVSIIGIIFASSGLYALIHYIIQKR